MATPPTSAPVLVEVPPSPTIPDAAAPAKTPTPTTPTTPTPPWPVSVRGLRKAGQEPTLGRSVNDEPVDPAILEALSRKGRAGRRPGAVWDFFTPLKTAQNRTHATCNFCARRCAGVAARMTAHILDKCPAAPAEATEALTAALAQGPSTKRQRIDSGLSQSQAMPTATATATASATEGSVGKQQVTVGLAAFRAHATSGNARSSSSSGLLLRDESKDAARLQSQDTLTLALHKLVVACLRRHVPLSLVEDEFFRDALALLRPGSAFALKQTTGSALVESVHATVVNDIAQWMRASQSFTLLHRGGVASEKQTRTTQWRGADDKRHGVLLVERRQDDEAMAAVSELVQSLLPLVGEETIVGVCSESLAVLAELAASGEVTGRVKLWSSCLLKRSLELWSLVVQFVPQIASVALGAAEIASIAAGGLQSAPGSSWTLPFTLIKRVLAMSQTLKLSETQPGDSEGMASAARSEFWKELAAVDALLAPFSWLFVLGESDQASSSHFVLLWVWLVAEIEASALLTSDQRESLKNGISSALQSSMQDHHLVALLLDPRLCGIGLSATGRRKVKGLVVQVATRLWPIVYTAVTADGDTQADDHDTKLARQSLLTQLGHYLDKSAYFTDEVAWEMAQGSPPETFWKDYAKDAPELTKLAMAVLTFVPVSTQLTTEREPAASEEESFLVRQTRYHFERNRKNGDHDVTALLVKHSELLAPIVSIDTTLTTTSPSTASSSAETKPPSASSSDGLAEAVGTELERVCSPSSPDHSATPATPHGQGTAVEMSWFAFETDADRSAIKTALRHLVPPALLSRPAKSTTDFTTVLLV